MPMQVSPIRVDTMQAVTKWTNTLELDTNRNEVLLFSGAPSGQGGADDIISIIKQQGFDERVASLNGLFGAGVYFAEKCSKADAYAGKRNSNSTGSLPFICVLGRHFYPHTIQLKDGLAVGETAYMYVARVCLGNPYVTSQAHPHIRRPPTLKGAFDNQGHATSDRRFDSVVYDGTGRNYKEFMVCYIVFVLEHEMCSLCAQSRRCMIGRNATLSSWLSTRGSNDKVNDQYIHANL